MHCKSNSLHGHFCDIFSNLKILWKMTHSLIKTIHFSFLELLWVAPELLDRSDRKTKPGDIYSYGIILAEIMSREDPYAERQMDPKGNFNL